MNAPGEIWRLAEIAQPDVGVITNVAPAHLEGVGSLHGAAEAKAELFRRLRPSATAVVNADDPLVVAARPDVPGPRGRASAPTATCAPRTSRTAGSTAARFTLRVGARRDRRCGCRRRAGTTSRNALAAAALASLAGVVARRDARRARGASSRRACACRCSALAERRHRDQRRLQRQPGLDGGGAPDARREPRPRAGSRCSARCASSARRPRRRTRSSGARGGRGGPRPAGGASGRTRALVRDARRSRRACRPSASSSRTTHARCGRAAARGRARAATWCW